MDIGPIVPRTITGQRLIFVKRRAMFAKAVQRFSLALPCLDDVLLVDKFVQLDGLIETIQYLVPVGRRFALLQLAEASQDIAAAEFHMPGCG